MARLSKDKRRDQILRAFVASARRSPATVRELIRLGNSLLGKAEVCAQQSMGSPLWDAKYLTYFGLGLPYYEESYIDARVTEPEVLEVLRLFEERVARRVPAQYVTHEAFYLGNYFYVDENVLVPRTLMGLHFDAILAEADWTNERILDLCCGSGVIGITLALKRPTAHVDLVDVSEKALAVAKKNIDKYKLGGRVRCYKSDLFSKVEGPYSLIATNPPYVDSGEYEGLPAEYKNEPKLALDAGPDGLKYALPILEQAPKHLTPTGTLAVEVGYYNEARLASRFPGAPFKWWREKGKKETGVFTLKNGYRL